MAKTAWSSAQNRTPVQKINSVLCSKLGCYAIKNILFKNTVPSTNNTGRLRQHAKTKIRSLSFILQFENQFDVNKELYKAIRAETAGDKHGNDGLKPAEAWTPWRWLWAQKLAPRTDKGDYIKLKNRFTGKKKKWVNGKQSLTTVSPGLDRYHI